MQINTEGATKKERKRGKESKQSTMDNLEEDYILKLGSC